MMKQFLKFMCILLFICSVFSAENEEKPREQEQKIVKPLEPSPDVVVSAVFPSSHMSVREFELSKPIELVLGFLNNGESIFNITSLKASLRYPIDWKMIIQNFTEFSYGVLVEPHERVSVYYAFYPDPLLDPREFGLQANVFYTDGVTF